MAVYSDGGGTPQQPSLTASPEASDSGSHANHSRNRDQSVVKLCRKRDGWRCVLSKRHDRDMPYPSILRMQLDSSCHSEQSNGLVRMPCSEKVPFPFVLRHDEILVDETWDIRRACSTGARSFSLLVRSRERRVRLAYL